MSRATKGREFLATLATVSLITLTHAESVLQVKGSTFLANNQVVKTGKYQGGLQSLIKLSQLFLFPKNLDGERNLVLVRRPTRPLAMHRCGTGFEDFLALVRYRGGNLILLDKIGLQSCEKSVGLALSDATQPNEIMSAIKFEGDRISFSVVVPTSGGDVGAPVEQRYLLAKDHFIKQ